MRTARVIAVVVVCVSCAAAAAAQSFQGGLRGTVRDAQAVIPGVTVSLVNQDNGVARETVSNDVGEYSFPGVTPGTYSIRAALSGFKTFERRDVRIATQQFLALDIMLVPAVVDPTIDPESDPEGGPLAGCGCAAQSDRDLPSLALLAMVCAVVIGRRRSRKEVV